MSDQFTSSTLASGATHCRINAKWRYFALYQIHKLGGIGWDVSCNMQINPNQIVDCLCVTLRLALALRESGAWPDHVESMGWYR